MTQAKTPDGVDAFKVIAERLMAAKRPVDTIVAQVGDRLPAAREFKQFAVALDMAVNAYEQYLVADLKTMSEVNVGDIIDARAEAK